MPGYISLRDHVYTYIARLIQKGELEPGRKITEAFVCERLGISRTPAREALIQLASDGVLSYEARKGFVVCKVDAEQQRCNYEMMAVLDSYAAYLAMPYLTAEDFSFMHELIEKMDISIKYRNYEEYYELQERFHDVYVSKCNNPLLITSLMKLRGGTVKSTYHGSDRDALFTVLGKINDEHRGIAALFETRDAEAVERELRFNHWADKFTTE